MTDIICGFHAVSALLHNSKRNVQKLMVSEGRLDERLKSILQLAKQRGIPVNTVSLATLNQQFPELAHQGVAAYAEPIKTYVEADLVALLESSKTPALILILDGVTDPHNLGACLRTADAAGVDFVVIPKDKNASITPVVSKVASGAAEAIPVVTVTNLARSMEILKQAGVWIYGAVGEAKQSIYQLDTRTAMAIVMGAEGEGLRHLTRERCDDLFSLPMAGTVSSLNVSVATGVTLYEVVRQRSIKK